MIVLITGGRDYSDREQLFAELDAIHAETPITLIIFGACKDKETGELSGADRWAFEWALENEVDFHGHPARWIKEGHPSAGPRRNARMVRELKEIVSTEGRIVVAAPGGRGTANCCALAKAARVEVREVPR